MPRPPQVLIEARQQAKKVQAEGRVEIVELSGLPGSVLSFLLDRGFQHINCEGGPTLLAKIMSEVDEIDLAVPAFIVGTHPGTRPAREPELTAWNLDTLWTH